MTLKPPAIPAAILNFFADQSDFPAIAGDMSEEFHQRARNSSAKTAKRWFWREGMRTPVRTALMAFGCLLVLNQLLSLYGSTASSHPALSDQDILLLISFTAPSAMGLLCGRLLPGREGAIALALVVSIYLLIRLTRLPWKGAPQHV
jgi:hypothetical protein